MPRAIEAAGTIDAGHQLRLDGPIPAAGPGRVRVLILVPEEQDIEEGAWLRGLAANPAFDSLGDPAEVDRARDLGGREPPPRLLRPPMTRVKGVRWVRKSDSAAQTLPILGS